MKNYEKKNENKIKIPKIESNNDFIFQNKLTNIEEKDQSY